MVVLSYEEIKFLRHGTGTHECFEDLLDLMNHVPSLLGGFFANGLFGGTFIEQARWRFHKKILTPINKRRISKLPTQNDGLLRKVVEKNGCAIASIICF